MINAYSLQLFLMLISSIFLIVVLRKQWSLLRNTTTEYGTVRKIILGLVALAFIGNFTHIEHGHLLHSIQTLVMSIGWWLLYRVIEKEQIAEEKEHVKSEAQHAKRLKQAKEENK